jgi:hypothetical protein
MSLELRLYLPVMQVKQYKALIFLASLCIHQVERSHHLEQQRTLQH